MPFTGVNIYLTETTSTEIPEITTSVEETGIINSHTRLYTPIYNTVHSLDTYDKRRFTL